VEETIKKLSANKATGLDGIPAEIYKILAKRDPQNENQTPRIVQVLTKGFNDIKNKNTIDQIPVAWNKSRMILLHKGGDQYDIANYRPITLIQIIYKIYATILARRLTDFIEKNNFLSHTQTGFRPERGTAQKLMAVKLAILHAKRLNTELHIVSIDIKKAFDSVEHWAIKMTLGENGLNLPESIVTAIMATLSNTTIQIQTEAGLTAEVPIHRGVRQGDPLSAILFDIAIDPLLQKMVETMNGNTPIEGPHAYADDIDIFTFSAEKMQPQWQLVMEYCRDTGLELNEKKTQYIRNEKAHQNGSKPMLSFDQEGKIPVIEAPLNSPFRVLGVWFTTNADWTHHKNKVKGMIVGQINTLIRKKITGLQLIAVINAMQMAALAYGMAVVSYTHNELTKIMETITTILRKKFRFQGPKGWEDWFTLNTKDFGGLNLQNAKDRYRSAQLSAFQTTLLDYDSPAKRELERLERELSTNTFKEPIEMPEHTVWDEIIETLSKCNSTIHTLLPERFRPESTTTIAEKAYKECKDFKILLDTIKESNEQTTPLNLYHAIVNEHTLELKPQQERLEAITMLEGGDRITLEAELYESSAAQQISEINKRETGRDRASEIVTLEQTNVRDDEHRYATIEYDNQTWEPNFTDGSASKHEAAWGAYIPTGRLNIPNADRDLIVKPQQMFYNRVEGEQTNIRAELTAILAVLTKKERTKQNQLIITDSEFAIQEIEAWPQKTTKRKRLTGNRDLLTQIQQKIDIIENKGRGPKVMFLHIYSHQKEASQHHDPKREAKIQNQKKKFGNDQLYEILRQGNEVADKLAEKGRLKGSIKRNWIEDPPIGTDKYYILTQDKLNDKRPQQWIKEHTQNEIYYRRTEGPFNEDSRSAYLHYLPLCDRKLSFQAGKLRNPKQHHIYITLAKMRFHAAPTMAKLNQHLWREWTDPFRAYMKSMYPSPDCHFCEKKNVKTKENTEHLLTCPNRDSRNETAEKLWNSIWNDIAKHQQNDDPNKKKAKNKKKPANPLLKPDPRLLKPFALRNATTLASHEAALAARGGIPLPREIAGLCGFPDAAAGYALIPSNLSMVLRELWVRAEDAHSLAAEFAKRAQEAVVREYHERCRTIATERDAKGKFAQHVLGK